MKLDVDTLIIIVGIFLIILAILVMSDISPVECKQICEPGRVEELDKGLIMNECRCN